MVDMQAHGNHVSQVLGQMVKKWCSILPEGVRALEKFSRENNNVLIQDSENKQKILTELRLKNFKGTASGQRLDLTLYTQVFEPLNEEALGQKQSLSGKEVSNGLSGNP